MCEGQRVCLLACLRTSPLYHLALLYSTINSCAEKSSALTGSAQVCPRFQSSIARPPLFSFLQLCSEALFLWGSLKNTGVC